MKIYDLFVFTNFSCNMNCSFCSRREFLEQKDSLSAEDRLKKFKDIFELHPYTVISFTGGEPLQNLEFLLPAITFVREHSKTMMLSVYTNGSLLTKNLVDFFNYNNVKLFIAFEDTLKGEKSVLNAINLTKNISLIDYIRQLNQTEIVKVVFASIPFAESFKDLSLLFPSATFQFTLDSTKKFTASDITFIKIELQKLINYPVFKTLKFLLSHKECNQRCFNLEETGLFRPYPCRPVKGWNGCGDLVRRFDTMETLNYFIETTDKFKHEMQIIHSEEDNDKTS